MAVKCFPKGSNLVRTCGQEVKESNDSTFELSTPTYSHRETTYPIDTIYKVELTSVDGSWAEGFPNNSFTDVGSYEERNTRAQSIAFLQQLIQQQDNQPSTEQLIGGRMHSQSHNLAQTHLKNDEQADTCTQLRGRSIHASHHIHNGLANSYHHPKHLEIQEHVITYNTSKSLELTFLGSIEECSVLRSITNL